MKTKIKLIPIIVSILLLFNCSNKETVSTTKTLNSVKYTLDSMRIMYPHYRDSLSSDSNTFFLSNYPNGEKTEMLGFDSKGNYMFYFNYLKNGKNLYGAFYDSTLNIVKEDGSLFSLVKMKCFDKSNNVIFGLYPITPPFFTTILDMYSNSSKSDNYIKVGQIKLNDDRNILYEDSTYYKGKKYMGIVSITKENYIKKDTFFIEIDSCKNNQLP